METLRLKAKGLSRYSDPLSARPQGSLNEADNIVIDQEGLFSPRRGFEKLPDVNGTLTGLSVQNIIPFSGLLYVYCSNGKIYRHDESAGTYTEVSGFTGAGGRIKYAEASGNLYITSSKGVYKLESNTSNFIEAGVPEALHFTTSTYGVGVAVEADNYVGYKCVWGRIDANNNLTLGPPSSPVQYKAPATKSDVTLTIPVPSEIQGSSSLNWFCQVFRTKGSTSALVGDEYKLVYEHTYTSGTSITVVDQTPDDLQDGGKPLYTNETSEGAQSYNDQPPSCNDMEMFNNYMFYANLSYKHSINFQLLATGGTAVYGLDNTDTITIVRGNVTEVYTAKTTPTPATKEFQLTVTSDPASDIRFTAEAFVKVVNEQSALVYAFYDSSETSLPGLIRLEERDYTYTAFTVVSNSGQSFSPSLASARPSSSESQPNVIAFSKNQESEAVPRGYQYFPVGSKAYPIQRIMALRDSLFIFKGDGIWRLTGTSGANFAIDAFDSSTRVIAPDTLCVLNNLVFGLFDQGVCKISESGVQILSLEIEGDIRGWIGEIYDALAEYSFGLQYETERKYMLWVPVTTLDTYPTKGYVYNTVTDTWTVFDRSSRASVVNPANDRLYIAPGSNAHLSKERKDANYSDYSDEQRDVTVTAIEEVETDSFRKFTITESLIGVEVGDLYYESSLRFSKITDVNTTLGQIIVTDDLDFSLTPTDDFLVVTRTVKVLELTSVVDIKIGATVTQGALTSTVVKVDRLNKTIELAAELAIANGSIITVSLIPEIRADYRSIIEWNPVHLDAPGHLKQWFEALVIMTKDFNLADLLVKTEQASGWETVALTGVASDAWGLFPWGEAPWGGGGGVAVSHRTFIPRTKQRAGTIHFRLEIPTMFAGWEASGFEVTYRDAGYRMLRR